MRTLLHRQRFKIGFADRRGYEKEKEEITDCCFCSVGFGWNWLFALFEDIGVKMYFEGSFMEKECGEVKIRSVPSPVEIYEILMECM